MTTPGVLRSILASKEAELPALDRRLETTATFLPSPRDVAGRLRRGTGEPFHLVTEIKFRSPSAGPLSTALDVEGRTLAYARGGAAMISVLCDKPFFGGDWSHVSRARRALDNLERSDPKAADVPILAKEFVLDPRQVAMASREGADAILVIVRITRGASHLEELMGAARDHRLTPLVEVADEDELRRALDAGATVVGVNARDLDTLAVDGARAARVLTAVPREVVALHLSGVRDGDGVRALARGRADGALVGEALMKVADPTPLLSELRAACVG